MPRRRCASAATYFPSRLSAFPPSRRHASPAWLRSTVMELLERTPLLSELGALLREAASGRGALALVGAEAGGGKSALVGRFCAEARGSARILVGACDPLATPRPLGPLLDIAAAT